jgi:hypothetical protein
MIWFASCYYVEGKANSRRGYGVLNSKNAVKKAVYK